MTASAESVSLERGSVGRPRNAALDDLILEAVRELLVECGYHALSVQEVTRRCNVHVRTIARRWPTKAELVAAAIVGGDEPGAGLLRATGRLPRRSPCLGRWEPPIPGRTCDSRCNAGAHERDAHE